MNSAQRLALLRFSALLASVTTVGLLAKAGAPAGAIAILLFMLPFYLASRHRDEGRDRS